MGPVDGSSGEVFGGVIGGTVGESRPWWPEDRDLAGAPNVVMIVFDDVGFSDFGCFGSDIETPTIDELAAGGLRYTNFHTTSLCSPTRACLLTGRNHHSVGMGVVSNWDTGFPGYRGRIAKDVPTLADVLRAEGYGTFAVGKWHLAPMEDTSPAGPFEQWPLQRGFDRFYGFMDGATNQWTPELVADNHRVEQLPDDGPHLSDDLVDRSIEMLAGQLSADPDKPFFLYLAFGTGHYPLHCPPQYLGKYRGRFDDGWDAARRRRLARQVRMGLIPDGTTLPPRNPDVPPWETLSADERQVSARLQEAYAGMVEHTDVALARLVTFLRTSGVYDDTVVVLLSDNGASGEGGRNGSVNYARYVNGLPDPPIAEAAAAADVIGSPQSNPMYPAGWAQVGNTPFKRYKQTTHSGGIRDALIISHPSRIGGRGGLRHQYHHAIDLAPTILAIAGVRAPDRIEGVGMSYTFDDGDAPTRKRVQYYEMLGHRAIWRDGWKAVTHHAKGTSFDDDVWELYDTTTDASECHDLAASHPDLVGELVELWWAEAQRYEVLPLDDRIMERFSVSKPNRRLDRQRFVYYPGVQIPNQAAVDTRRRSYTMTAHVQAATDITTGVIVARGDRFGGYVLYIADGRLTFDYNRGGEHTAASSAAGVVGGATTFGYRFTSTGPNTGHGALLVDGQTVGDLEISGMLPVSEGMVTIGRYALTPVVVDHAAPFAFDGMLERVIFEVAAADPVRNAGDAHDLD
jgi:arylsulfatase A-like enzyme